VSFVDEHGEVYEIIRYKPKWKLHKFKDPENKISKVLGAGAPIDKVAEQFPGSLYETTEFPGNVALNEGLQELIKLISTLSTSTAWSNAAARLGVGNSTTAASAAQTGLIGSHLYKPMDATYPQRSSQTAIWRTTFSGTVANFAWYEFSVCNTATNSGKNLNRKISTKGTKGAGESWTLELQITFS
jgi:hypothetical protein